jgi:hypothetical protein
MAFSFILLIQLFTAQDVLVNARLHTLQRFCKTKPGDILAISFGIVDSPNEISEIT